MISRAVGRCSGFLVVLVAAACGHDGGSINAPVVTAGSGNTVSVGAPYTLAATFTDSAPAAGPWTYEVRWGDGSRSSGSKTSVDTIKESHAYAAEGSYTVTVAVTNRNGAKGTGSLSVTATAPVLLLAGDIGDCRRGSDEATAALLDTLAGIVVPLGDNAYPDGTPEDYASCYEPNWGRHKARTRPIAGNHDYNCQPGRTDRPGCATPAAGYFGYFGAAAGDPATGYYSYQLGGWLVIALNSGLRGVEMEAGSAQEQWLRQQLGTHSQSCVLALLHHPRFSTIVDRPETRPSLQALWTALYEYGADLVVNAHDHSYQRFAPQRPDGTHDATYGLRQITVGTGGGERLYEFAPVPPDANLEVRNNETFGLLKLTLKSGGYDWRFVPVAGGGATFTDSGSGTCHGRPM